MLFIKRLMAPICVEDLNNLIDNLIDNINTNNNNIHYINNNIINRNNDINNIIKFGKYINNINDSNIIDTINNNHISDIDNIINKYLSNNLNKKINDLQHANNLLTNKINILKRELYIIEAKYNHLKNERNRIESINATANTLCSICMTNPNNFINTSCGHMSVCSNCLSRIANICPICRQIGNYIQVHNSGVSNSDDLIV